MSDEELNPETVGSQSKQPDEPEISGEDFFLLARIESQDRALQRLKTDLKMCSEDLAKYRTQKARYERILQRTVLSVYDGLVRGYRSTKFYRCQDCYKRRFRTRLYKEHETYQRIYLCPTCLISANQLPNLKFVRVLE
jgi:hypothetical protein